MLNGALDGVFHGDKFIFEQRGATLIFAADRLSTCQAQEMQKQVSAVSHQSPGNARCF